MRSSQPSLTREPRSAAQVVTAAAPESVGRAEAAVWAISRLAADAGPVGLDLRAEVVLHPVVIERFAAPAPPKLSHPNVKMTATSRLSTQPENILQGFIHGIEIGFAQRSALGRKQATFDHL